MGIFGKEPQKKYFLSNHGEINVFLGNYILLYILILKITLDILNTLLIKSNHLNIKIS